MLNTNLPKKLRPDLDAIPKTNEKNNLLKENIKNLTISNAQVNLNYHNINTK